MSIDRYEITGVLRQGRTGNVYEAMDTNLKRKVAIRRFSLDSIPLDSPEYKEKFAENTAQLATLQHPNLLTIFDTGFDADGPYIVSATQEGYLLFEHLQNVGTFHEYDVHQMAQQLLDVIISSHSLEIYHGALSLRSLLVKEKGYGGYLFKLIDLGINQLLFDPNDSKSTNLADLTIMAPELFDSFEPTIKSDLYTIGQLCYVALIGGHPNAGADTEATKTYHQTGQLPHISNYVDINAQFAEWIHGLMAIDPAARPESAANALRALSRILVPPAHMTGQQIAPAAQPAHMHAAPGVAQHVAVAQPAPQQQPAAQQPGQQRVQFQFK